MVVRSGKSFRLLILLPFLALMIGCYSEGKKVDFIFINGSEPESLDPSIITGQAEGRIASSLFEGLTARNQEGIAGPGMAESWNISPDGKTYTFKLRNARWSNGDSLTSVDFLRSWERALNPLLASKYAELLYPIAGAQAYNEGKTDRFGSVGVKAPEASTLIVTLENPTPFFLDLCSMPTLYPVHFPSIKAFPESWTKPGKLVSNGAYTLESWRINDRIVLAKNPNYWRAETVHFDRVAALTMDSATTAFNLYYSGKADLIMDKSLVPSLSIQTLRLQPYFHGNAFLATYFYRFNTTRKPFNDARVRMAFALSIDKRRIVEKVTRGGEPIANSFSPPGINHYLPPSGLEYNPSLAKKLLAEAGYSNGKKIPPLNLLYNSSEGNQAVAVEIQAMWQQTLGVHVTLRNQAWKVYLNSLDQLDFDIARSSWVGDYNDANTFLDCFVTGRGNNRTGWSNPAYDRMMAESRDLVNPDERALKLKAAETLLIEEEFPIVPIYHFVGMALYDAGKLGGFSPNVVDDHPIRELYWKNR